MGDVISITDAQGKELVQYEYDEWGKNISVVAIKNTEETIALANNNPLRYRGYYYDTETGYYYLQSRYYDPSICRFINADSYEYAQLQKDDNTGLNIFVYCYNSPINHSDAIGYSSTSLTAVGVQLELSANLSILSGALGAELVYIISTGKLYVYWYYSKGVSINATKIKNSLKKILSKVSFSSSASLKSFANIFKVNFSVSIGLFGVFTESKFSWPKGYTGAFSTTSISINKVKGYKSTGTKCKAYGVCYAPVGSKGFCFSKTSSKYYLLDFSSYISSIKNFLAKNKNTIKKAVS